MTADEEKKVHVEISVMTPLELIDDVKTTGATIEECAKVLSKAGATEIYAAVLVRVAFLPGGQRFPTTI